MVIRILKVVLVFAVLISGAVACKSVKAINSKASMQEGAYFKRMNILVSNMERSLKIYEDILCFSANAISISGEDSYSYPVFKIPKEAKMRFGGTAFRFKEQAFIDYDGNLIVLYQILK